MYPYKDSRYTGFNFAIIRGSRALYEKFRQVSTMFILWERHRVDTTPLPLKCKSCGLLGHTTKRCQAIVLPDTIKKVINAAAPTTEVEVECADCMTQDFINRNNKRYVNRPLNHKRFSNECKTYMVLCRRRFRAFKDTSAESSEVVVSAQSNASEGISQQENTEMGTEVIFGNGMPTIPTLHDDEH